MRRNMNELNLWFVVTIIMIFALSQPSAKAAEASTEQDALNVINQFNESITASYEGAYTEINNDLFTNNQLAMQVSERNRYIADRQKDFFIESQEVNWSVLESKEVSDRIINVLIKREVKQELRADDHPPVDFLSVTKEGYVLVKEDGIWKIAAVVDELFGYNPQMDTFVENINLDLSETTDLLSDSSLLKNFSGIDYEKLNLTETIKVSWNGKPVIFPDQEPINENGRVLVPIRALVNAMTDYSIVLIQDQPAYSFSLQHVTTPNTSMSAVFTVGQDKYNYYDEKLQESILKDLYAPLQILNDRTMISVRTVGELFGDKVIWNGENKTVEIWTDQHKTIQQFVCKKHFLAARRCFLYINKYSGTQT